MHLVPQPLSHLLARLRHEVEQRGPIFDLPRHRFYPGSEVDLSVLLHGRRASSPIGPAAGPHTQLAQNLPAIALGVSPRVLAGLAVFRGMWAIFIHSNIRLPLGPLAYLLGSPQHHHYHHAKGHGRSNFGNLAPWLDVVFGTHETAPSDDYPLGIEGAPPLRFWTALWTPFVSARRG